jgi:hypothetical protein
VAKEFQCGRLIDVTGKSDSLPHADNAVSQDLAIEVWKRCRICIVCSDTAGAMAKNVDKKYVQLYKRNNL